MQCRPKLGMHLVSHGILSSVAALQIILQSFNFLPRPPVEQSITLINGGGEGKTIKVVRLLAGVDSFSLGF